MTTKIEWVKNADGSQGRPSMTNKQREPQSLVEACQILKDANSEFVRLFLETAGVFKLWHKILGKR